MTPTTEREAETVCGSISTDPVIPVSDAGVNARRQWWSQSWYRGFRRAMKIAAIGLASALSPPLAPASADTSAIQPTVQTASGMVTGVDRDGVSWFKGIPYARPPVGPLRWRAPQKPLPWEGIRDAAPFGAICMQPASPDTASQPAMSEDCLTINVWRHAGNALSV